ncbi:MAG: hypothetical protein WC307_06515 [Candidatus Nanoarchaeia archaeon]|jgi:hypothetical protein
MSQQPTTRRDDLIDKACGEPELTAFIQAMSQNKVNELSDRVHKRFWNNDVTWEIYWDLINDELQRMRDELIKLNKEPAELGSNI